MATESEMLKKLVDCEALDEPTRDAFADMRRRVLGGRALTRPQREWAEELYGKHELDADDGAENLVSRGLVPRGVPEPDARHLWSLPLPLEPPHRLGQRARKLQEETGFTYEQSVRCAQCAICQSEIDTPGPGCECTHAPCVHDANRVRRDPVSAA